MNQFMPSSRYANNPHLMLSLEPSSSLSRSRFWRSVLLHIPLSFLLPAPHWCLHAAIKASDHDRLLEPDLRPEVTYFKGTKGIFEGRVRIPVPSDLYPAHWPSVSHTGLMPRACPPLYRIIYDSQIANSRITKNHSFPAMLSFAVQRLDHQEKQELCSSSIWAENTVPVGTFPTFLFVSRWPAFTPVLTNFHPHLMSPIRSPSTLITQSSLAKILTNPKILLNIETGTFN